MKLKKINLFIRTIRSLKTIQVVYRLWYLVNSKLRMVHASQAVGNHGLSWNTNVIKVLFVFYRQWTKKDIENKHFCFLNNAVTFDNKIDWCISEKGRLWKYNLHYFQYLLLKEGIDSGVAVDLIKDWIKNNPIGSQDAWDPFPISLRLVNWIKFFCRNTIPDEDRKVIVDSMVLQARWLVKHLEYHLLGNHLFKNGKALIFMGLFFKGAEAEKWLKKGMQIIRRELDEQILDDGGHFERSPMYHSMVLEDCLDLQNIMAVKENPVLRSLAGKLEEKTGRMIEFLVSMCHPDDRISLFNDAAFGIEPELVELVCYHEKVTGRQINKNSDCVQKHKDTGYYILAPDSDNKMILDCGHVGPDYQPGHSHCDALSFELSVKGRRVIVDSGCFQYEDGDIREYNRGNIGHNTITIDNENQSEVWGAHRCGRKAVSLDAECRQKENGALFFRGGHDGYKRLKGKPVHFREVTFQDQVWMIHDRVEGKGKHIVQSRLHLHPAVELEFKEDDVIVSNKGEGLLKIRLIGNGEIDVEKGWYCPEFGKKYACDVLVYQVNKIDLPFECGWQFELEG